MQEGTPSLTALACALFRGLHTRSIRQPIFTDPWGDVLVPEVVKSNLRQGASAAMDRDDKYVPFYLASQDDLTNVATSSRNRSTINNPVGASRTTRTGSTSP